jgi:hypothetical protein
MHRKRGSDRAIARVAAYLRQRLAHADQHLSADLETKHVAHSLGIAEVARLTAGSKPGHQLLELADRSAGGCGQPRRLGLWCGDAGPALPHARRSQRPSSKSSPRVTSRFRHQDEPAVVCVCAKATLASRDGELRGLSNEMRLHCPISVGI